MAEINNKDFPSTDHIVAKDDEEIKATSADYYFDSYAHFGIHEEMIKDNVRTGTYRAAILNNKHLFRNKIVLDVGCGTGILSMFCIKAGAKHVYGIECSEIARHAKTIVKNNNMEKVITIIKGKVEEVELPVMKVDIIISEWMGYFLLYESMLDTVLFARDKWLKSGGLIFPDKAHLYLTAIEDAEYKDSKIDFWERVYGFDMSCIKEAALTEPLVDMCEPKSVISDGVTILSLDLHNCIKEDQEFTNQFIMEFNRSDYCHALVAYFAVEFSCCHTAIEFSTGPLDKYTHWKQTIFYLDEELTVNEGEKLLGEVRVKRNSNNKRDLDIAIATSFKGKDCDVTQNRLYRLR